MFYSKGAGPPACRQVRLVKARAACPWAAGAHRGLSASKGPVDAAGVADGEEPLQALLLHAALPLK